MLPTPPSFVSRSGAYGGYQVTGWKYEEDVVWHVKAVRKSSYKDSKSYVVRDGAFDPDTAIPNEKVAILSLIAQWKAAKPTMATDSLDLNKRD